MSRTEHRLPVLRDGRGQPQLLHRVRPALLLPIRLAAFAACAHRSAHIQVRNAVLLARLTPLAAGLQDSAR